MRTAWPSWGRRLLDLAGYAVGLTVAAVLLTAPFSLLASAGWNGIKVGLFLLGTACFGYATLLTWPSRPDSEGDAPSSGEESPGTVRTETRFEAALDRVPPWRWYPIRPADRFHPGTKLYAASLLMLAVSYLMETAFGVRA